MAKPHEQQESFNSQDEASQLPENEGEVIDVNIFDIIEPSEKTRERVMRVRGAQKPEEEEEKDFQGEVPEMKVGHSERFLQTLANTIRQNLIVNSDLPKPKPRKKNFDFAALVETDYFYGS